MKLNNTILKTGALAGILAAMPFVTNIQSAEAAPRTQDKREVRESRREVKEAKRDLKDARKDLRDDKRDLRRNNNHNNWNNRPAPRPAPRPIQRTLTGTVTSESRNGFTLRTGNSYITVSLSGGVPQRISRGDTVQVYGFQTGNAFRASSVRILRNR